MRKTTEFDPASYLNSEEVIAEYLNLALDSGNTDWLLVAKHDVAKSRFDKVIKVLPAPSVPIQAHPVSHQS